VLAEILGKRRSVESDENKIRLLNIVDSVLLSLFIRENENSASLPTNFLNTKHIGINYPERSAKLKQYSYL
jgi:hypothetical protein